MKLYIPQFEWGSIWKSLKERGGDKEGEEEEAIGASAEYLGHGMWAGSCFYEI